MTSDLLKLVGERIRILRKERGLTQEALSEKADIHTSYISGIENADRNISIETLEKITTALEVTPIEIFQFHKINVDDSKTDKKKAITAFHSLLAERSAEEIQTLLRVAKEIVGAIEGAK